MAWLHAWLASPMAAAPAVLQYGRTALDLATGECPAVPPVWYTALWYARGGADCTRNRWQDPSGECLRMLGGEQCQPLSTKPAHGWRHGSLIIQPMHASFI